MHYAALATDYDGTIAHDGRVDAPTLEALERLRGSGRKLILVTGRELDDLIEAFPRIDVFDRVVAENGAVLYRPDSKQARNLAEPPPPAFAARLRAEHVDPLSVGRVIVATWQPNEGKVLDAIRELGLELQIIFNKGAVMVLPAGVNKESGLRAALADLGISPLGCVAVGDAENDFAFLNLCGAPVAVSNALRSLKDVAVLVTEGARGAGVAELCRQILDDDLAALDDENAREHVLLAEGLAVPPHRERILLAGASGGGKSTLTLGWLERIAQAGFQYCVIDPEGDYEHLDDAVAIGTAKASPTVEAVIDLLWKSNTSVAVNLLGVGFKDRPSYFAQLVPELVKLRARAGRPHVIVVDEAHHVLPAGGEDGSADVERGMMFITVGPDSVSRRVIGALDRVIAVGDEPDKVLAPFRAARNLPSGEPVPPLAKGRMVTLSIRDPNPRELAVIPGEGTRRRHVRKYAEGKLGPDKSFFFRGREGRMSLRAPNLMAFLDLADGVDEDTFVFHRERRDYSRWVETCIKDSDLAQEIAQAEASDAAPADVRAAMRAAVERRYTLPA